MAHYYIGQEVYAAPVTFDSLEQIDFEASRHKPIGTRTGMRLRMKGVVCYVHPQLRFITVRFPRGHRESFFPQQIITANRMPAGQPEAVWD